MSPLYRFDNKLLIHNDKLATTNSCCCFKCLSAYCGCDNYSISFSDLWHKIKPYVRALYTCTRNGNTISVRCGDWKPISQRECCTGPCYDIWNYILEILHYDDYTKNNLSPAKLDELCPEGMIFPIWLLPQDFDLTINNQNRFLLPKLDRSHIVNNLPEGIPNQPWIGFVPDNFPLVYPIVDTKFVTLYGEPNNNNPLPVNRLLSAGSFPPYVAHTYYANSEDCRKCYGALFKLGTPDTFNRESTVSIDSVIINAIQGTTQSSTQFSFNTQDTLDLTNCMSSKFGNGSVSPYGILTDQLANSPFLINISQNESDNYFEFDLRYKYEITWDDPSSPSSMWYPFTNKWKVKYGPYGGSSFLFVGDQDNYYQNGVPQPVSASISSLEFTDGNTGVETYITINWSGNGIQIGNDNCSFPDIQVNANLSRSAPTITISSTGIGTGATFNPTLQQLTENNGQKYWVISNVTIGGNGIGYTNNEILKVNIANGDVEQVPAILRLIASQQQIVQPDISASIDTNSSSAAVLSVVTEQYQNNPNRWRISNILINNGGAGYDDGVYIVNFSPYNNSIQGTPGTALAITKRNAPSFSYSIVSQTGQGANIDQIQLSTVTNSNGQKAWNFDYYVCGNDGFVIEAGGNGYLSTDYLEIMVDSQTVFDNSYSPGEFYIPRFSANTWRIPLDVDENGTIIGINGDNIFNTEAFYTPTGEIETVIVTDSLYGAGCGHSYPSHNPALYGGSYYKILSGGQPIMVVVDNMGKYYHPNPGSVRSVSGPCISNIKMDIWHPGPCGLESCDQEAMNIKTGSDTPWEGYYYGNLIQDEYIKYWVYYDPISNPPGHPFFNKKTDTPTDGAPGDGVDQSGICPCCIVTNFGLIVVKYEGCENFRAAKNYEVTLQQYEMDFEHCHLSPNTKFFYDGNVYLRDCIIQNERRTCGDNNPMPNNPQVIDYKNAAGGCSNGFMNRQLYSNIPVSYTFLDGTIQCVDMSWDFNKDNPNKIPGFDNCASGLANPVWVGGNIICNS